MTETVISSSGTTKSNESIIVIITLNLENVALPTLDIFSDFLISSCYGEAKRNLFSKYMDIPY